MEIKVVLTDKEKEAIKTLASASCDGIACSDCPYSFLPHARTLNKSCFIVCARNIATNQGLNHTTD